MDNKYKYTYEKTANYCYKGTDVLINKLIQLEYESEEDYDTDNSGGKSSDDYEL